MLLPRSSLPAISSLLLCTAQAFWLPETLKHSVTACEVPKNPAGSDDSPTLMDTVKKCGNSSQIVFIEKHTYNLLTPVAFTFLENVEFVIKGNISLPTDVSKVEAIVKKNTKLTRWFTIKNSTGVTITGSKDPSQGWFVGHGEKWWPMKDNNKNKGRPHFFGFTVVGLRLRNLKVYNPVAWVFSLGGQDILMTDTVIDARSDDNVKAFPFNTDGIDLSATDVVIDGWTSWNGDDVINVSPPAKNVTMRNVVAYGTHGVAVSCSSGGGAGGDYLFENVVIEDSVIGARFKGHLGTACQIEGVTWRNFTITNTGYPIHFIANYVDQEKGVEKGTDTTKVSSAKNFKWEKIVAKTGKTLGDGTCITDPCWTFTEGQSTQKSMYIMCSDHEHCKNFRFKDVVLVGANGNPGEMECTGLNKVEGMGIPCTNGTLPTN